MRRGVLLGWERGLTVVDLFPSVYPNFLRSTLGEKKRSSDAELGGFGTNIINLSCCRVF